MRDYGRVFCALWRSRDFRSLNEDGRALVLYLLTCAHGTMIGAFSLPELYACDDMQWTPARLDQAFAELFRKGFARHCLVTNWVWICKFLDWNEPDNPNQWKAARKLANKIPQSCTWEPDFQQYFAAADEAASLEKPLEKRNRSRTLSKPGTGTGTGEGSGGGTGTGSVTGTGDARSTSNGIAASPGSPETGVCDGQDDHPLEPSNRRNGSSERRNGDFEAINEGVSKLLSAGAFVSADTRGLARALHCSVRQVEVAIGQLRDRGKLPQASAA